jgi:hypothetical protein
MDRPLLGPADVADDVLAGMVADLLRHDAVDLLDVAVQHEPYDIPSLTTVGRYWVTGTAGTPTGPEPFRLFVKHVQGWHHSPFFQDVPDEMKEMAKASYPWRTEPLAYASDLGDRLPAGLSMPRALGVHWFDPDAAAIWMAPVEHPHREWDTAHYRRAAYLLGRLAASPAVAERADVGEFEWSVMHYVHGRLEAQVGTALRSDDVWQHPLVAAHFDTGLRDRMRAALDRCQEYGLELMRLPQVSSHGDASPGNLMPGADPDSFVLIDFGLWHPQAVGYDLGQLVAGDVQLGRRPAALLAATDEACLTAYAEGLAAEGTDVDPAVVRRGHALQLLLFVGLSALPFEMLEAPPSTELERLVAERAALATFSLDLVDAS